MIASVLTLGKEGMQIMCVKGPQGGRPYEETVRFYGKMKNEWGLASFRKFIFF